MVRPQGPTHPRGPWSDLRGPHTPEGRGQTSGAHIPQKAMAWISGAQAPQSAMECNLGAQAPQRAMGWISGAQILPNSCGQAPGSQGSGREGHLLGPAQCPSAVHVVLGVHDEQHLVGAELEAAVHVAGTFHPNQPPPGALGLTAERTHLLTLPAAELLEVPGGKRRIRRLGGPHNPETVGGRLTSRVGEM